MLLKKNVVQVAVCEEDTCDQNDKPSNPPAPMPPTYYHYFHTLPSRHLPAQS